MLTIPFHSIAALNLGGSWTDSALAGNPLNTVTNNPDTGSARGKALLMAVTTNTQQARRGIILASLTHAEPISTYNNAHTSVGLHLVGARFGDGGNTLNEGDRFLLMNPTTGSARSGIGINIKRDSGAYYYELMQDVSGTPTYTLASRELTHVTSHDVRVFIERPTGAGVGQVVLQTKYSGDADWVTEISEDIADETDNQAAIRNMNYGIIDANGVTKSPMSLNYSLTAVRCVADPSAITDMDFPGDMNAFWRKCHALDVSDVSATIRMNVIDGEWADATHARIVYQAGDEVTSGTATTAREIGVDFDTHGNYIETIGSLSANTAYAAVVQVGNSDFSTVYATSHTFRFRTVPTKGATDELFRADLGCIDHHFSATCVRLIDLQALIAEARSIAVPHRIVYHGDLGYSDSPAYFNRGDSPYETEAGFDQMNQEVFCCDEIAELASLGAFMSYPDDHDVSTDDGYGSMRPGGSLYNTDPDDWPGLSPSLGNDYGASTTLGDITDAGLAIYESWWGGGWINRAVGTEFYGVRTAGKEYEIIFDTRWLRDLDADAGERATGAMQMTWIAARIAEAAADSDITDIRLLTGGPLWEIGNRNDDNVGGFDRTFTEWLIQELLDNVRSDQRIIMRCGDAHMHACFHLHLPNGTGAGELDDSDERFVYEAIIAGNAMNSWMPASGANSVFNTTAVANDTIIWAVTPGNANVPSNTQWGVSSGLLSRRSYTAGTLDHWFQSGNGTADSLDWGDLLLRLEATGGIAPIAMAQYRRMRMLCS